MHHDQRELAIREFIDGWLDPMSASLARLPATAEYLR
jgi:hypothetical protein